MNKIQSIQRSKLISSYGGVGSIIDTIDNLAYIIKPFNEWKIYKQVNLHPRNFTHLTFKDERLITRLHNIGFDALDQFFLPDDNFEKVKFYNPDQTQINRMVTAEYAPKWFYCENEKCGRLKPIQKWKQKWEGDDDNTIMEEPRCAYCRTGNTRFRAPRLQQVRFVLASLENGELKDLPWDKLWKVKNGSLNFIGKHGEVPRVWDFRCNVPSQEVSFHIKKGGSDLIDIYIKSKISDNPPKYITLTMAEIMNHYFILEDGHVYQPVIRSANNVYFPYTMSSLYIPRHLITQDEVDKVVNASAKFDANDIHQYILPHLSVANIQYIIDNGVAPNPDYRTEESFRTEEFDYIANHNNYNNGYLSDDNRLESWEYQWTNSATGKPAFIKDIYLLKHLEVTSVQVAYSRLERVDNPDYGTMTGRACKQWFDIKSGGIVNRNNAGHSNVFVGLHPTCQVDRNTIRFMPAVVSCGEGFFVELDLTEVQEERRKVFTHTYAHLVMKELEFSCGYPIPSMNERLYILPAVDDTDVDRYGFIIYSANGEAGSYGGISTLFENHNIENILNNAIDLAEDCPNDPICESKDASCFACVQLPETACEKFNKDLSRKIFKDEYNKNFSHSSGVNNTTTLSTNQLIVVNSKELLSENSIETAQTEDINSQEHVHTEITPGIILG